MAYRRLIREISGLAVILLAIFLFVSLLSYSPADPSLNHYLLHPQKVRNRGGIVGAVISDLMIQGLGEASYVVAGILLLVGFLVLLGREIRGWWVRSFGALLSLLSLTVFLETRWGRGGALGKVLEKGLEGYLNLTGALLLCAFLMLSGVMLATGLSIGDVMRGLLAAARAIGKLSKAISSALERRRSRRRIKRAVALRRSGQSPPTIVQSEKEPLKVAMRQEDLPFPKPVEGGWRLPPPSLLTGGKRREVTFSEDVLWANSQMLENKLRDYGVEGKVVEVKPGPVVTVYEFEPAPGVKLNRIVNLEDDLALSLSAHSVRIEAPIPGKSVVGIEIANPVRETVYLKDVVNSELFRQAPSKLTLALGKDISGNPFVVDLSRLPHLLVAGATGSGKSVSLNCMIASILLRATPDEVKFMMVDPKMLELLAYEDIPHLLLPVVTDPREAATSLRWVVGEMERRYAVMAEKGTKHIERFNQKVRAEREKGGEGEELKPLPYIIVVIDELADLMIVSRREVEESITRLAQMARAAGIHIILATQRPSVDVITGLIKVNFPARISFQVSTKVDSRTILDTTGAEHLLGTGDMLFLPPGSSRLKRVHGAYISEEEIKRLAEFWRSQGKPSYDMSILEERRPAKADEDEDYDEKYEEAVAFVMEVGQASVSLLQRRFKIGYNRAARIIERMEREGIVGPSDGVKPREVLIRK